MKDTDKWFWIWFLVALVPILYVVIILFDKFGFSWLPGYEFFRKSDNDIQG